MITCTVMLIGLATLKISCSYCSGLNYYGCYYAPDWRSTMMHAHVSGMLVNTLDKCSDHCRDQGVDPGVVFPRFHRWLDFIDDTLCDWVIGFAFMSQRRINCYCGNYGYNEFPLWNDTACDTPCSGNSTQMCGGSWKMSAYGTGEEPFTPSLSYTISPTSADLSLFHLTFSLSPSFSHALSLSLSLSLSLTPPSFHLSVCLSAWLFDARIWYWGLESSIEAG